MAVRVDTMRHEREHEAAVHNPGSVGVALGVVRTEAGWVRAVFVAGRPVAPHDAFALAGALEGAARQAQALGPVATCEHGLPARHEGHGECGACAWERANPERAALEKARVIKEG